MMCPIFILLICELLCVIVYFESHIGENEYELHLFLKLYLFILLDIQLNLPYGK